MSPLLFAAAVAFTGPPLSGPSLDLQQRLDASSACNRLSVQTVAPDGVPFKKLGELPPGVVEHAVLRRVDGCPVREVRYGGQTYYIGPASARLEAGPDVGGRGMRRLDRRPLTPDGR